MAAIMRLPVLVQRINRIGHASRLMTASRRAADPSLARALRERIADNCRRGVPASVRGSGGVKAVRRAGDANGLTVGYIDDLGGKHEMSIAKVILRSLAGLIFLVFGLNLLLHFLPNPAEPAPAADFLGALFRTGYLLPLLGVTQAVSGALLLIGIMVPFALVLIAPVIVNILMFHIFLAPSGLPVALVVVVLEIILAWMYRDAFVPLFSARSAS
jgi:putative oxidoreductase